MFTLRQYTDFSFKSIAKCSVLTYIVEVGRGYVENT